MVAIDHWKGSPEHHNDPELAPLLPRLYDTFLAENWDYRERIIPLRMPSVDGLRTVAQSGLVPDLVYIDGDHSAEAVRADLMTTLDLFPTARIVGDDWDWPGVQQAVEQLARERQLKVEVLKTAWRIIPRPKTS